MQAWLSDHKLVSYLIILGFTIYIFNKVFRAQQKLPLFKEILVYALIAFGSFVLMILQVDKLPIIQCMGVAVLMMLMLRGRQLYDKWKGIRESKDPQQNAGSGK
ncbi:YlaH-like family protein [Paenibacillus luteus]|uniref:YlaH-like family protein n=1 Tax=Paenibacillus luteus TaxID=2545753 RepID=UPI0011439D13|nr:YlaH-like family protein [Paenibacillus luteus]